MPDSQNPPRWEPGRLPGEANVEKIIAVRYANELRAMAVLHDQVMEMVSPEHWNVPRRGFDWGVFYTVALTLNKCLKTFRAVHLLAERGFVMQAHVLNRQLAEQVMMIVFILRKRSKMRARLLRAYEASEFLKMLRHWQRTPRLKRRASTKLIQAAEQTVRFWADQLPPDAQFKSHWSGLGSLENALTDLRLQTLYATLFRFASRYTHGLDFTEHIVTEDSPEGFAFTLHPETEGIDGVSIAAREMLWLAATTVNKKFKQGYDTALAQHQVKLPEEARSE